MTLTTIHSASYSDYRNLLFEELVLDAGLSFVTIILIWHSIIFGLPPTLAVQNLCIQLQFLVTTFIQKASKNICETYDNFLPKGIAFFLAGIS